MARKVTVVPHTHWDREWYAPFEAYRSRLVALLDQLLPMLENDPAYSHFMLDGQMAMVDDYLALRPEAETLLRRLAVAGRLAVGPWYTLMDEFAVSGETIVRNLEMGINKAAGFGGAMRVGYLPDMFGHVCQMPQLLRQAGLAHAVVWRGVPAAIDRTGFWWRSPDGSTVRAEYLPAGYASGAWLPQDAAALHRRVSAQISELADLVRDGDPLLVMNGTDHQSPQPWLAEVLAEANRTQDDFAFEISSLSDYLGAAATDALPSWEGELRSGARADLPMGVLSNRVDVKIAAAVAERTIERLAEPLAALWVPPEGFPTALLERAWLYLVRNSAHDSACGCSIDPVNTAVLHRYFEARAIGEAIVNEALGWAALAMSSTGPVVLNPSARATSGVVELEVPGSSAPPGAQLLAAYPEGVAERAGSGRDLARLLGELGDQGWLDDDHCIDASLSYSPEQLQLSVRTGASAGQGGALRPLGSVIAEAATASGARRDEPLRVRVSRQAWLRVATRVERVPGFGWCAWRAAPLGVAPVSGKQNWLDNGLVHLAVNPSDGTFSINGLSGLDRLIDGGDAGDSYNYSAPSEDLLVDRPDSVRVDPLETGPVRGRLRVTRQYRFPASLLGGRRAGSEPIEVVSELELAAGDPMVRIETRLENRCRDHRLRSWFPLPERASHSDAECAFAVVKRGLSAEGGGDEHPLPTFPARRFVSAGGLTLIKEGLLEYQLADDGWALALTLFRATGVLSRQAPSYRPHPAGPPLETPAAQLLGPLRFRYALVVGDVDAYEVAERAWVPLVVVAGSGAGDLPERGSHLTVMGAEISSLRRTHGAIELRVFNPRAQATSVRVPGRRGWLIDLRGKPLQEWSESFALAPWGIATARVLG